MGFLRTFTGDQVFPSDTHTTAWLLAAGAVLLATDILLRGFALWRAARLNKPYWFVALLIINSVGILPAIYLLMTNEEYKKRKK